MLTFQTSWEFSSLSLTSYTVIYLIIAAKAKPILFVFAKVFGTLLDAIVNTSIGMFIVVKWTVFNTSALVFFRVRMVLDHEVTFSLVTDCA